MSALAAFGRFLYDFVVGDDPWLFVAVVVVLGLVAAVAAAGLDAWWLVPLAVVGALTWSVRRAS